MVNHKTPNGKMFQGMLEEIGDNHSSESTGTPIRDDAFEISEEEKMDKIEVHFKEIMNVIGLDLKDDSLSGTPRRVAKMFIKEIFAGLNPENKPATTLFKNNYQYRQMLVERNIKVHSTCEHHFLPIYGKAHVAYIPNGKVVGLSKLNRIVEYYSKRPQVQERLTIQIANELRNMLGTDDVAVYIDAKHMCVQSRGIQHEESSTVTSEYSGKFLNENVKNEFLQAIKG
ncbi:MAG: GTP cyclohydrolase I [Saprospiraceae bacterium]|jgi:GTP cyclohydrolase I